VGARGEEGEEEEEEEEVESVLAPALFGGVPAMPSKKGKKGGKDKNKKNGGGGGGSGGGSGATKAGATAGGAASHPDGVCTLPPVVGFDASAFQQLCASLVPYPTISPDESLGLHFIAALSCARFAEQGGAAGAGADVTLSQRFHCCCDGLGTSKAMRQAGHTTLEAVAALRSAGVGAAVRGRGASSEAEGHPSEDDLFAKAAGVTTGEFMLQAGVWRSLQAGKPPSAWLSARAGLVVAMLRMDEAGRDGAGAQSLSSRVRDSYARQSVLSVCKKISGRALSALSTLPRHLYASFLTRLYVLINLASTGGASAPGSAPVLTPEELAAFLSRHAPQLEDELGKIWYVEGDPTAGFGALREEYQRPSKKPKKKQKR
jgi:hypothetical protein